MNSRELIKGRFGFKRTERLNDQIRKELADILATKVKDPRIGFITVTSVDVSPDLRHAKVFVSFFDAGVPRDDMGLEGLKRATSFIRGELGRRLKIRYIPEIVFQVDRSIQEAERMVKLLDQIGEK